MTVSDYNSWNDIYRLKVTLEDEGTDIANFYYKQYESPEKWEAINEFSEDSSGKELLVTERCSYTTSKKKETVDDLCDIELIMVFKKTYFTKLKVSVVDRAGEESLSEVDYKTQEIARSNNIIVIPGIDNPIYLTLPSWFLNFLAIIAGIFGAMFCIRRNIVRKKRLVYEKNC